MKVDIESRIDHVISGLENCIGNAKLRGDSYDQGYLGAIKKEVEKIKDDIGIITAEREQLLAQVNPLAQAVFDASDRKAVDTFNHCPKCDHKCPSQAVAVPDGWHITHNQKPIPDRSHDYDFCHENYDGADGGNGLCGTAKSFADAIAQIKEIEMEMQK